MQTIPQLMRCLHACAGHPTIATWTAAIDAGHHASWPGLATARVNKHLGKSEETVMGHLKLTRQGVRSTSKGGESPTSKGDDAPTSKGGDSPTSNFAMHQLPRVAMHPHGTHLQPQDNAAMSWFVWCPQINSMRTRPSRAQQARTKLATLPCHVRLWTQVPLHSTRPRHRCNLCCPHQEQKAQNTDQSM